MTWLGEEIPGERQKLQAVLDERFEGTLMVGHVDIVLSRERAGWRVISAWTGPERSKSQDWRPQVTEALREAGIPLALS